MHRLHPYDYRWPGDRSGSSGHHRCGPGVGFRPAVARIATGFGLSGWVYNDAGSVHCELEGTADDVDAAISALQGSPPRWPESTH